MPENRALQACRGLVMAWMLLHRLELAAPRLVPAPLQPFLAAGGAGIDVLFVLSGLVLAGAHADLALAGVPRFLLGRLARVYPLNLVLTGGVAVLAWAGLPAGVPVSWPGLPVALAMAGAALPMPPRAWIATNRTVGIGLACWAIFPLLLIGARRLPGWLLATAVGALAWAVIRVIPADHGQWWGGPGLLRGVVGFALGVAIGVLADRARPWLAVIVAAELIVAIGLGAAVAHAQAQAVVLWATALLLLARFDRGPAAWLLRVAPLAWSGRLAFAAYLAQPVLIGFLLAPGTALVARMPHAAAGWVFTGGITLTTYAAAYVAWVAVEAPARRWLARPSAPVPPAPPARARRTSGPRSSGVRGR